MAVALAERDLDPAFLPREALEQWAHFRICGSIIRDAQLPIAIDLVTDRIDRGFEELQGWIVYREDNRDSRLARKISQLATKTTGVNVAELMEPFDVTRRNAGIARAPRLGNFSQQLRELFREPAQGKMMAEGAQSSSCDPVNEVAVSDAPFDSGGQRCWIVRSNEEPVASIAHPLINAADVRADH